MTFLIKLLQIPIRIVQRLSASRSICAESIDEFLNKTPSSSHSNNSVLSRNSSIDLELDLSEADTLNSVDVES